MNARLNLLFRKQGGYWSFAKIIVEINWTQLNKKVK